MRVRVRARTRVRVRVGLHLWIDDGARRELVRLEQWARVDLPPLPLHSLLAGLGQMQRAEQLATIRRNLRTKGLLEVWLFIHIPATIALLAALLAHVISVFYYW